MITQTQLRTAFDARTADRRRKGPSLDDVIWACVLLGAVLLLAMRCAVAV